jgi:hypothetical protein
VAEPRAHERAGVTAAGCEPVVAQGVAHQTNPEVGRLRDADTRRAEWARERGARKRGDDDVERVLWIAAVCTRIAERADEVLVVPERPRPAMREDDRDRCRALAALVDEVDRDAVEVDAEVGVPFIAASCVRQS